jgi:hypothetical protein
LPQEMISYKIPNSIHVLLKNNTISFVRVCLETSNEYEELMCNQ